MSSYPAPPNRLDLLEPCSPPSQDCSGVCTIVGSATLLPEPIVGIVCLYVVDCCVCPWLFVLL